MFLSIYRYSAIALGTDQARLMWPALSAMAVWVGVGVVGLADWGRAERGKDGRGGRDRAVAGLLWEWRCLAWRRWSGVIRPAFAPPQPVMHGRGQPAAPLASFGDLALVGVELPAGPLAVGQPVPVRLLWWAAAPLTEDLRPTLRLVHQDGWLAAEWSHSPAGGRYQHRPLAAG